MNHNEILEKVRIALMEKLTVDELAELYRAIANDDIRQVIYTAWLFKVDVE